ncbi:alpha-2-HS-glycoprotein [Pyxicephalus adspersus]|uniref:Cystatin fetuin-A-type domain-containing protein n=1 Tax=Pyxicephalus adspersus TaxID=30357 RepID=A0AAV3AM28_PYXAD|nr:TPA: hypothetical protein GDO54_010512 [Pyxicephalus adspersus]
MRLLLATLFLAQVLLYSAHVVPLSNRVINCDDDEAHQVAAAAVQYINAHHHHGYKFALNQVEKILPLSLHGTDEMFFIELELLETVCSHVNPTPLEQCAVRPRIQQAVEADCDFKVRKHNGTFEVLRVKCKSEIKSSEKIVCPYPDCSLLAPLNDSRVVHAVDVALHKFNSGNTTNFYSLHEIGRGKIQHGVSDVEFIATSTNCTKEDAGSGLKACVEESGPNAHFASCSGTVVKLPGAVDEDITVNCAIHEPQPRSDAPQPAPVAPVHPGFIPSRFHHDLHFNTMSPHSSESNSAEHHLLAAHANRAVKRSLTGQPVQSNVRNVPLCPGRKIHF